MEGVFSVDKREIIITDESGNSPDEILNVLNLDMYCKSENPCVAE